MGRAWRTWKRSSRAGRTVGRGTRLQRLPERQPGATPYPALCTRISHFPPAPFMTILPVAIKVATPHLVICTRYVKPCRSVICKRWSGNGKMLDRGLPNHDDLLLKSSDIPEVVCLERSCNRYSLTEPNGLSWPKFVTRMDRKRWHPELVESKSRKSTA